MAKTDIYREVKLLRRQMATLEKSCQEREDKLIKVLTEVGPYLELLTSQQKSEIESKLGVTE